jgi:hypothetical protein
LLIIELNILKKYLPEEGEFGNLLGFAMIPTRQAVHLQIHNLVARKEPI